MTRNTGISSVVRLNTDDGIDLEDLIRRWSAELGSDDTIKSYTAAVRRLFTEQHLSHPRQIDFASLVAYSKRPGLANNTIRGYLCGVRSFLRWCLRHGITDHYDDSEVRAIIARYPRVYGKGQAPFPARWLSYEDAFGLLVGSCRDGSILGLRDELVIRFGLLGMRRAELRSLTLANLADLPRLTWTGKKRKVRRATAGRQLLAALDLYLTAYALALGRRPAPDAPLFCPISLAKTGPRHLQWGTPLQNDQSIYKIVRRRAVQAGLGHVATHDLRRTAAGILHRSRDANGKHDFDLLDIQQVLGHSDPAVTMKCYLEPMDTEVIDQAATFLD